nr:unnamed protein product [Naegleria fowleri]
MIARQEETNDDGGHRGASTMASVLVGSSNGTSAAPSSPSSSSLYMIRINRNNNSTTTEGSYNACINNDDAREESEHGRIMKERGNHDDHEKVDGDHDRMDLRDDDDPLQEKNGTTNLYSSTSPNRSSSSPLKSNHSDRFNGNDEQEINDRMSDEEEEMQQHIYYNNNNGGFNQNKKRKNCAMDDHAQQLTLEEFCTLFVDSDSAVNNTSNNSGMNNTNIGNTPSSPSYNNIEGATFVEKMRKQQEFIKDIENTLYEFPFVESENSSSSEDDDDQSSDDSFLQSEESSYGSDDVSDQEENIMNNDEEPGYHYRPVPNSSKLNIITLSSLKFLPFEHPDRLEIENILYFHRLCKSIWFPQHEHNITNGINDNVASSSSDTTPVHTNFVDIEEILEYYYGLDMNGDRKKKIKNTKYHYQIPSFVIFQIIFAITEKLLVLEQEGKLQKIPEKNQDEHLFNLYRRRNEIGNVIETLFLNNVMISPRFMEPDRSNYIDTADFLRDDIGLSQFIDVKIKDSFEETLHNLHMHNIYLIRFLLSMLRINTVFRDEPQLSHNDQDTFSSPEQDKYMVPRVTLENLIGIEVVHIISCIAEDRKIFEHYTLKYLLKLFQNPSYASLFNHGAKSKYIKRTRETSEQDLLCAFFSGIALYGVKKLDDCVKYLLASVLHPPIEEDQTALSILQPIKDAQKEQDFQLKNHVDKYMDISRRVSEHAVEIEQQLYDRLAFVPSDVVIDNVSQYQLPYFTHVAYSFLGKALAEVKNLDTALYYTEISMISSHVQERLMRNHSIFNTTAVFTKAYIVDKLEMYEESSALYRKVIENYRGYSMSHNNNGICLKRMSMHKEAQQEYEESLRIDPSNHLTYNNRALYYNDNEHENAILYYKFAIRLKPTYHLPIANLGYTYSQMNKYDEAIDLFTKALFLGPNNITALANRGYCYMRKSQYDEASKDYLKLVLELKSEERNILYNLSLCMYQKKLYRDAIYYATKILAKNPNDEWVLYNRSLFFEKAQLFVDALEDIEKFLTIMPNNAAGLVLRQRLRVVVNRITRVC